VRVHVRFVPAGPLPGGRDTPVVVIDVLRATSTLTQALVHGADRVIEAATVEEARALRSRHPDSLLCGERDGRIVEGFDLGNSPFEYSTDHVRGRTLVFASTNGSQALRVARGRRRILAAFVNLSAVVHEVRKARELVIVCAGRQGGFSLEDTACAGMLVRRLAHDPSEGGGEASLAARITPDSADAVRALVEGCDHGLYLRSLGGEFARDVAWCAQLDTIDQAFEV
jgi:2-phosphosulfolactate phosphatase